MLILNLSEIYGVVTWPGDEVDAGARGGEHPAVVVKRPDLLLQRLHDL